jgi:hypothetical protein
LKQCPSIGDKYVIGEELQHITTKTTSSIKVTPEPAPIAIYRNFGSTFVVLGYNSTYFSNKFQKGKTVTNVVGCNIDIHSTRIKRLILVINPEQTEVYNIM